MHDSLAMIGGDAILLASASRARAAMLRQAGLSIETDPADLDEDGVKQSFHAAGRTAADLAVALAVEKARVVSLRRTGRMTVGADQVMTGTGIWFSKPASMAAAAATLRALSGRTHQLISAVAVCRDGAVLWQHVDQATLSVRPLSDAFIAAYLAAAGDTVLSSVGGYQVEGLGSQLFDSIDGDFFTVLGLPLLPLLGFLRQHGTIAG